MSFFKYIFIFILLAGDVFCKNVDFAVIVSKNSNITSISKKQISNIFLSKTKNLPNGEKAITLGLNEEASETTFYKKISGKNSIQLRKYWATVIFTGKGKVPKKMKNIQDIVHFVKNNTNAIAYIPFKDAKDHDVQIVLEL